MRCAFLGWILIILTLQSSAVQPPTPHSRSSINSQNWLLNQVGKIALQVYTYDILKNISDLDEKRKAEFFVKDEKATVGIILHEFATGTGPSVRYFDERTPFVQEIERGPAIEYLMHEYVNGPWFENLDTANKMRYQFSALAKDPSTWTFGVNQFFVTLGERNLSQFMLGSFFSNITPTDRGTLHIHIWNITSKRSYFLGLGPRVQRPLAFGNVTQHIYLEVSLDQAKELAQSYKQKKS